jgi:phage shock protein A
VRKYEKQITVLMHERDEAAHLVEVEADQVRSLKAKIEEYKTRCDELEDDLARSVTAVRRAERDRDEHLSHVRTTRGMRSLWVALWVALLLVLPVMLILNMATGWCYGGASWQVP